MSGQTRITFRQKTPNPLFIKWLEELYEKAKAKDSKFQYTLQNAISSINKYPLPLQSGRECIILKGFGNKICSYLDNKLHSHATHTASESFSFSQSDNSNSQTSKPTTPIKNPVKNLEIYLSQPSTSSSHSNYVSPIKAKYSPLKKKDAYINKTEKAYKPGHRTGSYAILISLLYHINGNPEKLAVTKEQLIENAQIFCDESFTRPKPNSRYTAWSSMSKLVTKGLVSKTKSRKAEFSLTDEGYLLAIELQNEYQNKECINDVINKNLNSFTQSDNSSKNHENNIININNNDENKIMNSNDNYNVKNSTDRVKNETYEGKQNNINRKHKTDSENDIIKTKKPRSESNEIMISNIEQFSKKNDILVVDKISDDLFEEAKSCEGVEDKSIETVEMKAGTFDVILLIDKQETSGASKKDDPTVTQFKKYADLKHEYRHLKVGDFTWIARDKSTNKEIVLPYIIERKRMDDLGASIRDGRFHEQKFRLNKCGIQNVLYLIENYGSNKQLGLPIQHLMQAIANTRVQNGFKVHITESLANSVRFLAMMSKRLTIEYKNKNLTGKNEEPSNGSLMLFNYFNKSSTKNRPLSVTETFIKLLLQLKGVSVEKAVAITNVYKTPRSIIEAYRACSVKQGEFLLANLKFGLGRNVGPSVSRTVYQLFTIKDFS